MPDYPCEQIPQEENDSAGSHNKSSRDRAKRAEKKPTPGRIDPYLIQNIIRTNYGKFRSCYEEGLRTNPNLIGRVTVRFVIELNGEVKDVQPVCTSMPDREVVRCMTEGYRTLTFPRPEGGIVTVVYPIVFGRGD